MSAGVETGGSTNALAWALVSFGSVSLLPARAPAGASASQARIGVIGFGILTGLSFPKRILRSSGVRRRPRAYAPVGGAVKSGAWAPGAWKLYNAGLHAHPPAAGGG